MAERDIARAASRGFCFTINNYTDDQYEAVLSLRADYLIVGKEVGANGTPHLQGYGFWKNKKKFNALKNALPTAHIESAKGTPDDNRKYCSKDGDFVERGTLPKKGARNDLAKQWEMIQDGKTDKEIVEQTGAGYSLHRKRLRDMKADIDNEDEIKKRKTDYADATLRDWQKEVIAKLDDQGDRKILFVVDEEGGKGKSWLSDYLTYTKNALRSDTTQKTHMAYAYDKQELVIFDLCRHDVDHVNYGCIETFKNKQLFCSKYESKVKQIHCKAVLVLMNQQPNMDRLSADRYDIYEI